MYNKYFTMKRSELKEAIKSEIKSVLSENRYDINDPNSPLGKLSDEYESSGLKGIVDNYGLDVVLMILSSGEYGDRLNESILSEEISPEEMDSKRKQAMIGGAKAEPLAKLATIGLKGKTVKIKKNQQEYKVEKVMANGDVLISRDGGEKTLTKRPIELELVNEIAPMGPGQTTTLADFEDEEEVKVNKSKKVENPVKELFFHADSYKKGMIDVDDIKQAFEEILRDYKDDIIADRSVSFSDIREEEKEKEEDDDAKDKKAYRGGVKRDKKKSPRDKAIDAYNKIGGSEEVREKAKKAKKGDKEALNWLLSNQKVIKAYNDIPK